VNTTSSNLYNYVHSLVGVRVRVRGGMERVRGGMWGLGLGEAHR
jgi:hypothetical protein